MELENQVKQRTSELSTAKEAAENANQTKDRFLARVSHDLRSPLNTIISYASILQARPELLINHSNTSKQLKTIENSGVHLLNLIEDILNFSKAEVDKLELHPTCFNWQSFLDKVIEMVELSAHEKHLSIKYQVEGNLSTDVLADQKRLQQVLINLLNNAIKFTRQGEITLKLTILDDIKVVDEIQQYYQQKIRFEVIDTGIGIDTADLDKIFLPFEQVGSYENQANGTGLGLSISQEIVALMGGKLSVRSRLGVGSVFWFDVTLNAVNSISEAKNGKIPKLLTSRGSHPTIIIVDEKEEDPLLVGNLLMPLGFQVFSFSNAKEALEAATFIQPDMFLLDLYMPYKSGFTLVRDLQKMPQFADVPIILMSSVSEDLLAKACENFNCQGFVPKPLDEKYLLSLLEKFGLFSQLGQLS